MAPLCWHDLDVMEKSGHQDNTDIKLKQSQFMRNLNVELRKKTTLL